MLKPEIGPEPTIVFIGVAGPEPVLPSERSQSASWTVPPEWIAVTLRR